MKRNIDKLISEMTLREKANLCSGIDFWHTEPVERLGIPSILLSDGPHGLRKQDETSDHLGLNASIKAICFPTSGTQACSWDRELIKEIGIALGEECQAENIDILLGPAVNIKRAPLGGRNFEYYSEDPYLSTELAVSYIDGVQSRGIGTSIKHFAVNNQEHRRMTTNAIVDERTLREIYLPSFKGAVTRSKPWTVMCAYNILNNVLCSESKYLLTKMLRKEWKYEGFVVSDWGGVDNRVAALAAGLELEMPGNNGVRDEEIAEAVLAGILPENVLNKAVKKILKVIFKAVDNRKKNATYCKETHHKLARKVAKESMVLLKNEDDILPLAKQGTIAVIGAFAQSTRYQGGGSSHVNPIKVDNVIDEIKRASDSKVKILYSEGYSLDDDKIDPSLISEAKKIAAKSNVAIIFAGLPARYESEGYDRLHIRMPTNHIYLIEEVAKVQEELIVVLANGSPVEMPWLKSTKGLIETYLGGQGVGSAIADILFGIANPSGKLAETFPVKLEHNPSQLNYPGDKDKLEYKEGVFIGYRYYDAKKIEPLFPFGYGLSYTKFEYLSISLDKKKMYDTDILNVSVRLKNIGKVAGKEIIQIYIHDVESKVTRPEKELKEFSKIELQPGEEKTVNFSLDKQAFAYYNVEISDWYVETGDFEIWVGGSSRDIYLKERVWVETTTIIKPKYTGNSTLGDIMENNLKKHIAEELIEYLKGEGAMLSFLEGLPEMAVAMVKDLPLYSLPSFSNGQFKPRLLQKYLRRLNEE